MSIVAVHLLNQKEIIVKGTRVKDGQTLYFGAKLQQELMVLTVSTVTIFFVIVELPLVEVIKKIYLEMMPKRNYVKPF